jgi:VanZ family protein
MTRRQLQRLSQVATILALLLILYLTLTPSPPDPGSIPAGLGHVAMFALLGVALALWYATSDAARRAPRRTLLMVLLVLWIIAGGTELAQELVDGRQPGLGDWFANMGGGIVGLFGGSLIARALLKRDQ